MLAIDDLLELMARLRDPKTAVRGIWRRASRRSRPYTIEEAYEVDDAIRREAWPELCDELGDLLLQVVFHAQMAREAGLFGFDDVVAAISRQARAPTPERVRRRARRHRRGAGARLGRAQGRRARGARRGRPRRGAARAAGADAGREARAPRGARGPARARTEPPVSDASEAALGDALFALARRAARRGIDPEAALRAACERFRARHARA